MEPRIYTLRHPENIHQPGGTGGEYFGCDQNWFRTEWQRLSGCAPSTAATLLLYHQKAGRITLPMSVFERKDCLPLMETVWNHVTPTPDGIYLSEQFCEGIRSFSRVYGFQPGCRSLDIPADRGLRPDRASVVDFIVDGLERDSPVAFLNLSSGGVGNLEEWHWVTIVALETDAERDRAEVRIYDGDKSDLVDFRLWYETTDEGGALVYLAPEAQAPI